MEVDFLTDFCSWLYNKKLTFIKLMPPQALEAGLPTNDNEE